MDAAERLYTAPARTSALDHPEMPEEED